MKEKRTGSSSGKAATNWNRLRSQSDRQIRRAVENDPEARPTDAALWKRRVWPSGGEARAGTVPGGSANEESRLKAGCSQDWLPHIAASRKPRWGCTGIKL